MKTMRLRIAVLCGVLLSVCSCSQVAITGRKRLNLVPDRLMHSMSFQNYREFLAANKLSNNAGQTAMVRRVGGRISEAVEKYCAENDMSDLVKGYKWEYNLVDDEAVNAWVMPGGKVVVYTGLLSVARDDAGLAVVMGHEVAHAIARHGSERMTSGLLVELGGRGLSKALAEKPAETQNLFMKSYNIGTEVGILLPYSRVHEKEADRLGLIFMAMAGFDPHEAVGFWQRMAASRPEGSEPFELLSTHPADATRIRQIQASLPEAMSYYRQAKK